MDVIEHFSCYTILPIQINDVREFIRDKGIVDQICFHKMDSDPEVLRGLLYQTRDTPPYFHGERVMAHVAYSGNMSIEYQRLVACKELLHILDNGNYTAATLQGVSSLITEISLPREAQQDWAQLQRATASDHLGVLNALAVLFPRDAISEIRPAYDRGDIGIEEIMTLTQVPEPYVVFAMTDEWMALVENVLIKQPEPRLS